MRGTTTLDLDRSFPGNREMAAQLRAFDWAAVLDEPSGGLPASLRVALGICLAAPTPMQVWWGSASLLFYNDATLSWLGAAQHPAGFGLPGHKAWPELWAQIRGPVAQVQDAGTALAVAVALPLPTGQVPQDQVSQAGAEVTVSLTPIWDETGAVVGVASVYAEAAPTQTQNHAPETTTAALQQRVQELTAELATAQRLEQVSTQLLQVDRVEALYEQLLDTALELLHADFATLQLFHSERDGGALQLLGARGFGPEAVKFWEWVDSNSLSTCGEALRTGRRVAIADIQNSELMAGSDELASSIQIGIRAMQTTPLFARSGVLLGMLSTHWRSPHELSAREQRTLDVLARQAADLIHQRQVEEALRRSEERLQKAISIETVGVSFCNLDGFITGSNAAFTRMSGYTLEEMAQGQVRWDTLTPPEFMTPTLIARQELIATGQATPYEKQYIRKDGSRFWGLFAPKLIGDREAVEFIIDITETKQAEEALHASEAQQSFLLQLSDRLRPLSDPIEIMAVASEVLARWLGVASVGYCEIDPGRGTGVVLGGYGDGRLPNLIDSHFSLTDYDSWLPPLSLGEDAFYEDNRRNPRLKPREAAAARVVGIVAGAATPLVKNGVLVACLYAVHPEPRPWPYVDRQLMHEVAERTWAAVERARAEATLRASEAQMRLLLESVQDYAIFTLDSQGRVTSWNEGARRLSGYTSEEILGQSVHRFYTSDDLAAKKPAHEVQIALKLGRSEDESWRVRKDGTHFWANEIMTPLRSEAGVLLGFVKISRDLSERRRMEARLEEQVKKRTAQVRNLVTQLTMSEQEERRRVSSILHDDLQQRLFSLIFQLTLLRLNLEDRDQESTQHILEIEAELRDAVQITRELSVDLSPPVLHNEGLLEALRWLAVQMAQQQGLQVDVQVEGSVMLLHEDLRVLLFQIVRELLFNVVKHAAVNAAQVRLKYVRGKVCIEVSDQGQGFVPQEGLDSSHSGQGLPRIEQRLQLLGGRVEIMSAPGRGTRILLEIPLPEHGRNDE